MSKNSFDDSSTTVPRIAVRVPAIRRPRITIKDTSIMAARADGSLAAHGPTSPAGRPRSAAHQNHPAGLSV